tara:strand:+ start:708 stop:1019 length:312 start_codon:yes stop_codon:yes gene_type:complete
MSGLTNASRMKIYFGPNKSKAKLVTLKELISYVLNLKHGKKYQVKSDRLSDDSYSWLDIIQFTDKGTTSVTLSFDPEGDSTITEINVYQNEWVLDDKNVIKII